MSKLDEFKISTKQFEKIKESDILQVAISQGIQQFFDVSEDLLLRYYNAARHVLEKKNYSDARDAFAFLIFLNPSIYQFWIGLGMANQSLEHYEESLSAYLTAIAMNPNNPIPMVNGFQCCLALNDREFAKTLHAKAMECCKQEKWKAIKAKLEAYALQASLYKKDKS